MQLRCSEVDSQSAIVNSCNPMLLSMSEGAAGLVNVSCLKCDNLPAIAILSTLLSSCNIMRQSAYAAASQSTDSALADVVRIVPITAITILEIGTPEAEASPANFPVAEPSGKIPLAREMS